MALAWTLVAAGVTCPHGADAQAPDTRDEPAREDHPQGGPARSGGAVGEDEPARDVPARDEGAEDRDVPAQVRLLVPSCDAPIAWREVAEALRVELRSMGSDLSAGGAEAEARLVLDVPCGAATDAGEATLSHVASGRSASERVDLGDPGAPDRVRVLALTLSELVRSRWPALAVEPEPESESEPAPEPEAEPEPPPRPTLDPAVLRAAVTRAVRAALPEPEPPPPGAFVDVALAVGAHAATSNATGELRVGASIPAGPLRLGLEVVGAGGWAGDPLGDVALAGVGGAVALRLAHAVPAVVVEAGPRIDVGWIHAEGIPNRDGVSGSGLDGLYLAVGLDARVRVPLDGEVWLLVGGDVGVALVGIDARADDRRVTAQQGPRLALLAGLAWHAGSGGGR